MAKLNPTITSVLDSNANAILADKGFVAKFFIQSLEKAVNIQSGVIKKYVDWLQTKNPESTPAEIQKHLDRRFIQAVTGSGAGVGLTSAIPGVGLFTGAAAVSAESVFFLDAAATYAVASGYLRGVDIDDPERRKALVLIALLGSEGTALSQALLLNDSLMGVVKHASASKLVDFNSVVVTLAVKQLRKSLRMSWLGKLLPLGIGAVAGSLANKKLARTVVKHVHKAMGPIQSHTGEIRA